VISHFSPDFYVNALRFLLEGYKVARDRFKDKKTPEHVEDIVIRAEKSPAPASEEIERSIDRLDPGDAAIVKGDLQLMSLLMISPPSMDAFDYWGKLTQLVAGLRALAIKNRLFELRGVKRDSLGEVLLLPRSGKLILPNKLAVQIAVSENSLERVKDAECLAILRKEAQDFPIVALVGAQFEKYTIMGEGPFVASDSCYFAIAPGQQRHWLSFSRPRERYRPHFETSFEYRLNAADLISIVQALKGDIRDYATDVIADEGKIAPMFAAIDAFAKGLASSS
jgi:hypothetical protein